MARMNYERLNKESRSRKSATPTKTPIGGNGVKRKRDNKRGTYMNSKYDNYCNICSSSIKKNERIIYDGKANHPKCWNN